jgi:hypothetical protein
MVKIFLKEYWNPVVISGWGFFENYLSETQIVNHGKSTLSGTAFLVILHKFPVSSPQQNNGHFIICTILSMQSASASPCQMPDQ